jgi:hypothetical protein
MREIAKQHPTRWLLLALPLVLALLIYHPYQTLPFDIWDFREFLPILRRTEGHWAQFLALVDYYAHQGRMNPLFYATFVAQYAWFGGAASGWQWLRFAWMALDVVLVVILAQRIGLRLTAGIAAAGLLVTATPATRAWVQLMAEPQALAVILGATLVALDYQATPHWKRSAFWIVLLVALAFLSKEVVGALGAVVLLIALFWRRQAGEALLSRRNTVLAVTLALVVTAELILLLAIRARPGAIGYGMAYGSGSLTLSRLGANLVAIALPVRPGADAQLSLLYPGNLLPILVLAFGLATHVRRRRPNARLAALIGLGLLPPLIGALVYLPWPKFDSFYGIPFFVGIVLLYAAAINELLGDRGVRRWFAIIAAVLIPCYGAVAASRSVETAAASLRLNAYLARLMGRFGPGDTVLVLSPPDGPHALPVKADELRDYATAMNWLDTTRAATILPAPCNRFSPNVGPDAPGPAFVSYSYGCGRFPYPALRIVSGYTWHDWLTLAAVHDTMALDLSGAAVRRVLRRP